MRNLIFSSLLVGFAVLVAGCGGGSYPPNVLRINIDAEVKDLDPQLVTGVPEHRVLASLFDGLTGVDPKTYEPLPAAAESWTISEDKRVYTFKLRANGQWSNGDPVTAKDFIYSYKRMLSPGLAADYAYLLFCLKNAKEFNAGTITNFDDVGAKALDDHTLELTLENPTPYLLAMQIHQAWFPVHQATIEAHGKMDQRGTPWTRAGNHVSNGPFRLTEWSPNEVIKVVRNEHYWDKDKVRLDGIQFYPIDDLTTEERSFRSGKLQMTGDVPEQKIAEYQKNQPELIHIEPYLGVYFYRINTTRPPFNDKRIRQALSLATDREELTRNVLKAGQKPAASYVPPGIPGYEGTPRLEFNPEKAKALLAEAGFPNGQGMPPVEILFNTSEQHKKIAEVMQQMWGKIGVKVELLNQDWKVYLDSTNSLDYSLARAAWIGDVVDPVNFLEMWITDGGNNRTGYANPAYDALLQQAYAEPDTAKRFALLKQAEDIVLDDLPIIPVYFYTRKYLQAPEVKGYVPNLLGYHRFQDFYIEP